MQQRDGAVALDGYEATIHDLEIVPNKPRRPVDFRMFTVPQRGEGIMPGRMMTVSEFNKSGQALSWDFKMLEPGTYEVAVVNLVTRGQGARKVNGQMRVTVAGQSVEGELQESRRTDNLRLTKFADSHCVLGTVTIKAAGTHTLALEVTSDFNGSGVLLRGVTLLPVSSEASQASGFPAQSLR
jgi:alpha-L-fucosidase